jgi:quercetin dioxygenase-like cupin family protein
VKRATRKTVVIKRLDHPDEERRFEKGLFQLVSVGGAEIGRAEYQPGWRWSTHVGPTAGTASCEVEHVGLVLAGRVAVKMDDGEEWILGPGDVFYVPPGHDSWVVGHEPYVSLHLQGAGSYAAAPSGRPPRVRKKRTSHD